MIKSLNKNKRQRQFFWRLKYSSWRNANNILIWQISNRIKFHQTSQKIEQCKKNHLTWVYRSPRVWFLGPFLVNVFFFFQITPHSVALHTCHATGYCNDANEKCMPHKVTNVTIEFGDYTHNSATPIPWIVANHTECVCVKMDLSKSKP